jgi:alpha-N-arabinofuranosidase
MLSNSIIKSVFAAAVVSCASVLCGQETASVVIDAKTVLGPVNPLIFGNNLSCTESDAEWSHSAKTGNGAWNPITHSVREDFLALNKDMGVKFERYPGGSDADLYTWTKFVGPKESRPEYLWGLDEWIEWCRALGAVPMFTLNTHITPESAADLVDYLNGPADDAHPWAKKRAEWGHPEPYGVKYFELGNETYFERDRFPTGTAYADWAEPVDKAMRARSPEIKTLVVGKFNWGSDSTEWNDSVFSRAKNFGDIAVHHTYVNGTKAEIYADEKTCMRMLMMASEQHGALYRRIHNRIKELSGREFPIAVTEYNGMAFLGHDPRFAKYDYYTTSWGTAFFCGDLVREMLLPSNHVGMANYFFSDIQLNIAGNDWRARMNILLSGAEAEWIRRPAYFVYRLWAQHTGTSLLGVTVEAAPRVTIEKQVDIIGPAEASAISTLASRREDGTICLMLFNRHMESDIETTVRVKDLAVSEAKYWQLTSPSLAYGNEKNADMETVSGKALQPASGAITVKLPKYSMTALELTVR